MPHFEKYTTNHDWAWAGQFSMCHINGSILKALESMLNGTSFAIIQGDGVMSEKNLTLAIFDKGDLWWFDNQKVHSAKNIGWDDRITLIFDVKGANWRDRAPA
jgi:hypothetical protein